MNENRNFPEFEKLRGRPVPLEELARLDRLARRTENLSVTGGEGTLAQADEGGLSVALPPEPSGWGLIVGPGPTTGSYEFVELQDDGAAPPLLTTGSGAYAGLAYEVGDDPFVPAGAVVRVWRGDGEHWRFSFDTAGPRTFTLGPGDVFLVGGSSGGITPTFYPGFSVTTDPATGKPAVTVGGPDATVGLGVSVTVAVTGSPTLTLPAPLPPVVPLNVTTTTTVTVIAAPAAPAGSYTVTVLVNLPTSTATVTLPGPGGVGFPLPPGASVPVMVTPTGTALVTSPPSLAQPVVGAWPPATNISTTTTISPAVIGAALPVNATGTPVLTGVVPPVPPLVGQILMTVLVNTGSVPLVIQSGAGGAYPFALPGAAAMTVAAGAALLLLLEQTAAAAGTWLAGAMPSGLAAPAPGASASSASYTVSSPNTWEGTGYSMALPAAGTYLVWYSVSGYVQSTSAADLLEVRLHDDTAGAVVPDSTQLVAVADNAVSVRCWGTASAVLLYTASGANTLQLQTYLGQFGTASGGLSVDPGPASGNPSVTMGFLLPGSGGGGGGGGFSGSDLDALGGITATF